MDFMKVFDQAIREIKREVNLKVLNVPEIEQKVLDATDSEPWGPHGSALSEIALATKRFVDCSIIMNTLWSRLCETGANWRLVYKALTVIEYLIANGSERALDDIIEHTYKISSLTGFAYVEPNGKDAGINVRKKAETLVELLKDNERIQAVRDKAASNRNKYIGLSSSGITYKSSSSNSRYGGFGSSSDGDGYKDSNKFGKDTMSSNNPRHIERKRSLSKENKGSIIKNGTPDHTLANDSPSRTTRSVQPSTEDDLDDFDPRGTSTTNTANSNEVDLFGDCFTDDFMDAPTETDNNVTTEVDLFADATFESDSPHAEATSGSHGQDEFDFFTSPQDFTAAVPTEVDLFAGGVASKTKSPSPATGKTYDFDPFGSSDSGVFSEVKSSEPTSTKSFDPFSGTPTNNFQGTDPFGDFTFHKEQTTLEHPQNSENISLNNQERTCVTSSNPAIKKDSFQVKSGIWADSLSRGLIDLNITGPKKADLSDIGIVGSVSDIPDNNGFINSSGFFVGTSSGANRSGFPHQL